MSKNVFYADLDNINQKGVLVTGHGKGIVNKNSIVNGEYIASDMVRLIVKDGELFGYQGYIQKDDNELTKIDYLLYLFAQSEPNQPSEPTVIDAKEYLRLSKHNIEIGSNRDFLFSGSEGTSAFDEYEEILEQLSNSIFITVPYTIDENQRVSFINSIIK